MSTFVLYLSNIIKMRLNRTGKAILRGDKELKKEIADAMAVSVPTIYRWIQDDDDNLTKAAVLKVILEKHKLEEHQILESESAVA